MKQYYHKIYKKCFLLNTKKFIYNCSLYKENLKNLNLKKFKKFNYLISFDIQLCKHKHALTVSPVKRFLIYTKVDLQLKIIVYMKLNLFEYTNN